MIPWVILLKSHRTDISGIRINSQITFLGIKGGICMYDLKRICNKIDYYKKPRRYQEYQNPQQIFENFLHRSLKLKINKLNVFTCLLKDKDNHYIVNCITAEPASHLTYNAETIVIISAIPFNTKHHRNVDKYSHRIGKESAQSTVKYPRKIINSIANGFRAENRKTNNNKCKSNYNLHYL